MNRSTLLPVLLVSVIFAACGGIGDTTTGTTPDRLTTGPVVSTQSDLNKIANVQQIPGDLKIDTAMVSRVQLNQLQWVAGNIEITRNASLLEISMPRLSRVDGDIIIIDNDNLGAIYVPGLSEVNGSIFVQDNDSLLHMRGLEELTVVNGALGILDNDALRTLDLPSLRSVTGDLAIYDNPSLHGTTGLTQLVSVGGEINVSYNANMTSVAFIALIEVDGNFSIANNDSLVRLDVPVLERVGGDFTVIGSAGLPECEAEAVVSRIATEDIGGEIAFGGLDADAVCE